MVMSTPTAIKNMDCSTCKGFVPIAPNSKWGEVTKGTCHRHAPVVSDYEWKNSAALFPVVYLPEFCLEYIAKD